MAQVTVNCIKRITTQEVVENPILQVVDLKKVANTTNINQAPRYRCIYLRDTLLIVNKFCRAMLTDSVSSIPAMIATQNNEVLIPIHFIFIV